MFGLSTTPLVAAHVLYIFYKTLVAAACQPRHLVLPAFKWLNRECVSYRRNKSLDNVLLSLMCYLFRSCR